MKQSQTEWILARLKQGPLSALDAFNGCGCMRLAARIADLRQAGYDIETEHRTMTTGKVVAVYHLHQKTAAIA